VTFGPVAGGIMSAPPRDVGIVGWYFILLLYLAWASYRSRQRVGPTATLPSRTRYFATTIVVQSLLLALSLLIARVKWVTLLPPRVPTLPQVGAGVAIALVLALGMSPLWKRAVATRSRRLHFFMPRGAGQKALWVGVSIAAGIAEEVTYRGMLFVLLVTITRSAWAAALLGALIFAAGHAFQSRASMAIIFGFALIFQGLAFWTGALYVSMLAHALYDAIAGLTYSRLGEQAGFDPAAEPVAVPPAAPPAAEAGATG